MKRADFLKEVIEEIETIKRKATKEEIAKLDFSKFNRYVSSECIYGQMTGYCESERAKEIQEKTLSDDCFDSKKFDDNFLINGNAHTSL